MRSFYQRLFPWRYLFQWLNHSPTPTNDFGNREFAFTLSNDAYLRYQSFPTADMYVIYYHQGFFSNAVPAGFARTSYG